MRSTAAGAALATTTSLAWGGQFVVGKSALSRVDPFYLTAVRYLVAALVLLALLVAFEGRRALRLEGRGLRLLWLGTLGFAAFNLLIYTGLAHAKPQNAALITALGPLLTALVLWLRRGVRPARSTLALLGVALVGVALVISGGDPASILRGSIGWGDALIVGAVLSFVLYSLGAAELRGFSPLRYTALTASLGWLSIAAATLVASISGIERRPSADAVWAVTPQLAYITLIGAVVAVLAWNASVGILGPQNAVLFGNLIPVTTFAIEIVRGYRPASLELVGASVTIAAVAASNLLGRRRVAPEAAARPALAEAA